MPADTGNKLHLALEHPLYNAQWKALRAQVRQACAAALEALQMHGELSVLLTDDAALRQMNYDFRGKDKPTNVLAFPSGGDSYMGDIAISLDAVEREAHEQGKKSVDHLKHLVVHAILHLLGYDHEKPAEAERMERKEIEILQALGIHNPYELTPQVRI